MDYTIPDFSDALQKVMTVRNLSVTDLTDILCYKSKTTIVRAVKRMTGPRGIKNLYTDLRQNNSLSLTERELISLEQGMNISINGQENYLFNKELSDLIFCSSPVASEIKLLQNDQTFLSIHTLFERLHGTVCQCLVMNSCYFSVTQHLQNLLTNTKEGSSVTHYVYFQNDIHRMISGLHASLPLLQSNAYHLYSLHPSQGERSIMGDMIVILCHHEDGKTEEYEIILHNEVSGVLTYAPKCYKKWLLFLEHYKESCQTLKTLSNSSHILNVLDTYAKLEASNDIYKLKRDLCLAYIPINIQNAALIDGCRELNANISNSTLIAMSTIQKRRYENIYNRKHLKHLVLSQSAMEKFILTGRLSDHFYLMRSFSICERLEILSCCVNQMKNNPFFHIYFLKDEVEEAILSDTIVELICFDRECVQIIPSISDYNLSQGHTEIFIQNLEFINLTKHFFQQELFKTHVTSFTETMNIFDQFISQLSKMLSHKIK